MPMSPKNFILYLIEYKFLQCFPLFVLAPVLCLVLKLQYYEGKWPNILLLFVQRLKTLKRNLKEHRSSSAHFFDLSPKIVDFLSLPKPRTKSPSMHRTPVHITNLTNGVLCERDIKVDQQTSVPRFALIGDRPCVGGALCVIDRADESQPSAQDPRIIIGAKCDTIDR